MKWQRALQLAVTLMASLAPFASSYIQNVGAQESNAIWGNWRGPANNGVVPASQFPLEWSKTSNVLFRAPLPGPAGSTPAVAEDRIFLTSADGNDLVLMCLSTTDGEVQWKEKITSGNKVVREGEGNSASSSPSTDGKFVWAMFGDGTLVCFSVEGKEVWRKKLQDDYGKFQIQFGMTSTPVLHKGVMYLQLIHGEWNREPSEGLLLALDAKTGDEIWQHVRKTPAISENKHSYASPVVFDQGEFRYLISHGADYVIANDLSTGEEIWRCGGFNGPENYDEYLRFVASPAVGPNLIVAPSAKRRSVVAIKPGGRGDITDSEYVVWKMDRGTPDVPSPLVTADYTYICRENGVAVCVDNKTGDVLYEERTNGHLHRASPLLVGDKLVFASKKGVVTILAAGPSFEELASNDLGEPISASPVVVGDRIYLRTYDALYAIGAK